jgi:hypothetical protein
MKKLLLMLMFAPLGICDAEAQMMPRDTTATRIEQVVVTGRGRNKAKRYFKRYVRKTALQGWYVGYTGAYRVDVDALPGWRSQGEYERNHIPGDDANRNRIELFKLRHDAAADSVHSWQIQRYILLAGSIAERAAALGYRDDATMSYRGLDGGLNTFLIAEPDIDKRRAFQTRILANDDTGLIVRSESVSRLPSGEWNVTADYALFEDFLYPTRVTARFEQRDAFSGEAEIVNIEMTGITPRRFAREAITDDYWKNENDPSKVLKKKVRDKLLRMR